MKGLNDYRDDQRSLQERYAGAIWLHSELTTVEGSIYNNFDPRELQREQYRITIHTKDGTPYSVETYGNGVGFALFKQEGTPNEAPPDATLVIFSAVFGESMAEFAVVSGRVQTSRRELSGGRGEITA